MVDLVLDDYSIEYSATLLDAAAKIQRNSSRAVCVSKSKKIVGVISEGDILRALLQGATIRTPIEKYVKSNFKYLNEMNYSAAWKIIKLHQISLIPILDSEFALKGIIDLQNVFAKLNIAE